jgi:UDP-glucose 6-dehydrogenase
MDLSYVTESAKDIGRMPDAKNERHTVAVMSTVVPGTTRGIIIPALEQHSRKKTHVDFDVAVNPEFMPEGKAVPCFLVLTELLSEKRSRKREIRSKSHMKVYLHPLYEWT